MNPSRPIMLILGLLPLVFATMAQATTWTGEEILDSGDWTEMSWSSNPRSYETAGTDLRWIAGPSDACSGNSRHRGRCIAERSFRLLPGADCTSISGQLIYTSEGSPPGGNDNDFGIAVGTASEVLMWGRQDGVGGAAATNIFHVEYTEFDDPDYDESTHLSQAAAAALVPGTVVYVDITFELGEATWTIDSVTTTDIDPTPMYNSVSTAALGTLGDDVYFFLVGGDRSEQYLLHEVTLEATCEESYLEQDTDGDGVPDDQDVCPGGDDAVDTDGDGTADYCDACPVDPFNDSDGDGLCDSDDPCELDYDNDLDGDGLCADVDPCPNDPDDDFDGDGICADEDVCPLDELNDADGDGICGNDDVCPGGDDNADADGDGTADFCDVCPDDAANDADADGICGDVDVCPLDFDNDFDGDGVCGDVDECPYDALDDEDGDGMCADVDPCPVDWENDADGDGICESDDNCPTVANTNQSNVDGDEYGDACEPDNDDDGVIDDEDNCPLDVNADQVDFDGDGYGDVCDDDTDGDGVIDGGDVCLGTTPGAPVLEDGCSWDQECACEASWKNHGAYVSCVAHATGDMVDLGVMTEAEKGAIQSEAGASDCGHKNR